ncbi:MAG: hypothetical protein HYY09_08915 [Firmicutes bacterium]|nr:hypothetical protein [Bacillota bacterium]
MFAKIQHLRRKAFYLFQRFPLCLLLDLTLLRRRRRCRRGPVVVAGAADELSRCFRSS